MEEESDADGSVLLVTGTGQQAPARNDETVTSASDERASGSTSGRTAPAAAAERRPAGEGRAATPSDVSST